MTVKEYCESNEDYRKLLDAFTQKYIDTYNKLRVAQRKMIKIYLSRNFGYWYHSKLDPIGEASPANFFNSDIAHKLDKRVTVYPVCKPVFKKDKLVDIIYTFNVFSMDNHPFVKDMSLLMNNLRDYIFPDNSGFDALSAETMIEMANAADYAFKETTYLSTLADVCQKLKLMAYDAANNYRTVIIDEKECDVFFALGRKEQLNKIISELVDLFILRMEESGLPRKFPTERNVEKILKKGIDIITFYEELFGDLPDVVSRFGMEDPYDFGDTDILSPSQERDDEAIMKSAMICALAQRYFFLPIGHYLQLIQPMYSKLFNCNLDNAYLDIVKRTKGYDELCRTMTFINYMMPPDCYKLSPLGIEMFRRGKAESKPIFPDVSSNEYKEVLDEMLRVDDDTIDFDRMISSIAAEMFFEESGRTLNGKSSNKIVNFPASGNRKFDAADKNAKHRFEVKRWRSKSKSKSIELKGTDSMAQLADKIISGFNLDLFHLYAFYMGDSFYDASQEIMPAGEGDPRSSAEACKIYKMEFNDNQKFLFLYDFGDEHRFQITFLGKE